MNKTMEYMAFGYRSWPSTSVRPVCPRAMRLFSVPNKVADLARLLVELIDDEQPTARHGSGRAGPGGEGTGLEPAVSSVRRGLPERWIRHQGRQAPVDRRS